MCGAIMHFMTIDTGSPGYQINSMIYKVNMEL